MKSLKDIIDSDTNNAVVIRMPLIAKDEVVYLSAEQQLSILTNRLFIFPGSQDSNSLVEALLLAMHAVTKPFASNLMELERLERSDDIPLWFGFSSENDLLKFRLALRSDHFEIVG